MKRILRGFVVATAGLLSLAAVPPKPATTPLLSLWRLDCGNIEDERASPWTDRRMPVSCYLIRHGTDYMIFDAGMSARLIGMKHPTMELKETITDQLKRIGVKPEQVRFVGISHYHGDHTGQAKQFPKAHLLMGAGDLASLRSASPPQGAAPTHLEPWLRQGAPLTELIEDHDVFGDGTVMMLMTSGHTPGHTALLVKLAGRPVILSGDLWAGNRDLLTGDMPPFNTSFAETEAARNRVRRLAIKHDAILVIGHDRLDIGSLPAFPAAAE